MTRLTPVPSARALEAREALSFYRALLVAHGIAPSETTVEQEQRLQELVVAVWEAEIEKGVPAWGS